MAEKEIILTVRPMTWDEQCNYDDKREEVIEKYKDNPAKIGRELVSYVLENMYADAKTLLTPAEVLEVYRRTMELSNVIRENEIKNLKPSSAGSTNEQTIAETAEK